MSEEISSTSEAGPGTHAEHSRGVEGAAGAVGSVARQIAALMESLPTAIGYFNSGRMRPLAVSEAERSPSLPDTPTFREAGFAEVVTTNWFGFSAPAGIPPEIAKRWESEIAAALKSDEMKEKFSKIGVRPGTLGGEAYTNLIRSELARWKEVIQKANIKAD